jgi:dephospho-CoA kinase
MTLTLPKTIQVWGLTGGIGSGKSQAAIFFEQAGVPVLNLDSIGKEILDNDSQTIQEVGTLLGPTVIQGAKLNKQAVRNIVFKNPQKRESLEKLLHPKIWKRFEDLAHLKAKAKHTLVLCEAALLIEHQHSHLFPRLVVIMADLELRKQRALQRDQMPRTVLEGILNSQTSDKKRTEVATYLLHNNGTLGELKNQVEQLVQQWKEEKVL